MKKLAICLVLLVAILVATPATTQAQGPSDYFYQGYSADIWYYYAALAVSKVIYLDIDYISSSDADRETLVGIINALNSAYFNFYIGDVATAQADTLDAYVLCFDLSVFGIGTVADDFLQNELLFFLEGCYYCTIATPSSIFTAPF